MNAILLAAVMLAAEPTAADKFSQVEIEKPFDRYLLANPLLMEVTGAKMIALPGHRWVLLSVASTVLRDESAKEILRAEKVCRARAFSNVVQEKNGVQVWHVEEETEKTVVINVNGKKEGASISETLEITKTKVEGIAKDLPVVGRWRSKKGDVFYMAIGAMVDAKGEPIAEEKK